MIPKGLLAVALALAALAFAAVMAAPAPKTNPVLVRELVPLPDAGSHLSTADSALNPKAVL